MAHACKKCDHEPFDTKDGLKNHSRVHASTCSVKFPDGGHGSQGAVTLDRDEATGLFTCPCCLHYESKFPAKMQAHCKTCKTKSDPALLSTVSPSILRNDDNGSYITSQLGFIVNEDLHIAICGRCRVWVEVGSLQQHALRFHRQKVVNLELLLADVERFGLRHIADAFGPYRVASSTLKEHVKELPVLDGFRCTFCVFYTAKQSTLKAHLRQCHRLERTTEVGYEACFVQRLSLSPGSNSWFGVNPPVLDPTQDIACGRLLEIVAREATERSNDIALAPYEDARHVPLYMKILHFDEFVQKMGGDVVAMAPLVATHAQGDARFFPHRLRKVCEALMEDFQGNIGTADFLLRKKLKSTKSGNISAIAFMRLDRSCGDYVTTLVHLILILLRSLDRRNADGGKEDLFEVLVPLDVPVRASLQGLWSALRVADGDGRLSQPQLGECKVCGTRLLEALFFRWRKSHLVSETSFLVYRFVLYSAIQHERVLSPDKVTHRISRMMYWCRSLVLHRIVHAPSRAPGGKDGSDAEDGAKVDDDDGMEVEDGAEVNIGAETGSGLEAAAGMESHFLAFVQEDWRTPFAAILEAKRLISSVTKNDLGLPKVLWLGDAQIVGSVAVDIEAVSNLVRLSIAELHDELKEEVLLRMPAYHSNKVDILRTKSGGKMEDNLQDNTVGHWFVSNENNRCSDYVVDLVHHIVRDATLRARFVERLDEDGPGSIVWNRDSLSRWMCVVGKWLQKLLSVVHILSGQPARGVEFLTCTIRNTPVQVRSVYYTEGLVMFLCFYGKADNLRGTQRPIARFLCEDTSFLVINYLTYVRKMEVMAARVLYGPDRALLYNRTLAVKEGRLMTSTDLTEGISALFLTHVQVPMGLRTWRHMAIAWIHRFLKYTRMSDLTGNGAVDSQAGHSQQLASRCYARSNFDHPSLGRDELQLYRLLSTEWHRILGLSSDALPPNVAVDAPGNSAQTLASTCPSKSVVSLDAQVSTATATHHHHHHHEVKVVHSPGDVGVGFPSLACSDAALRGLLSLGYTRFKSPHQAEAVHRILDREEDLLVVLPTSGEKTLLFLLPAVVESGLYTTVVICPFVALKKEMKRRVREADLSMCMYSEESPIAGSVDILLVSVEHCLSSNFQSHLTRLHAEGRLGRIVVDECHLAVTATEWRPVLRDLAHVRKVAVPLLLLSGTVPPSMEGDLREVFKSRLSVVRSSTNRPNISYEVRRDRGKHLHRLLQVLPVAPPAPKSIVFCRGIDLTEALAQELHRRGFSVVHYNGKLDKASKDAAHDAWTSGAAEVMIATGAFGTGIDLGEVRLVVHVDDPYTMIDLAQESGRGGRDGMPCKHVVLLKKTWRPRAKTCAEMVEYLGGSKCRRWALQQYIDGQGVDCFSSGSQRCDVCESVAARVRSTARTIHRSEAAIHASRSTDGDGAERVSTVAEDALHDPPNQESPSKRTRMADALFSESTKGTRHRHATESLVFMELTQYLKGNKDKCMVCVVRNRPASEPPHDLPHCPHLEDACFKCLAGAHGYSACPNRLPWKVGVHRLCFGCGLPSKLGQQIMHPEKFGPGCRSMGDDKLAPLCWHLWRNQEEFAEVLTTSGCPDDLRDDQFAEWLTDSHPTFRTNAIHLFVLYVQSISE